MTGLSHAGVPLGPSIRAFRWTVVPGAQPDTADMSAFIDRLLRLWDEPIIDWAAAETAFRSVYADPVTVNDVKMPVSDLIRRAVALQETYEGRTTEVVECLETPGRIALAIRIRGRHVGALATPLGPVTPTGRMVEIRVIDLLTLSGGLVTSMWTASDELGLLRQLDAIALASPGPA